MKHAILLAAGVTLAATTGFAQDAATRQVGGTTASGDATYSVQVTGANGVTYNCLPGITNVNGTPTRTCIRAGSAAPAFGGTLAGGGGAAAAGLIFVAALAGGGDGVSTTTTTN